MAEKHDIPQIVYCFGAILQGRGALIFMERMAGEKKKTFDNIPTTGKATPN